MTNKNLIRDSRLWWSVKILAATYQTSSTYSVFYHRLLDTGRNKWEARLDAVLAVFLVDIFLLAVLYMLESSEISTVDKVPMVLISLGLATAIVAIGITEEGLMAWGPRMGVLGLIFTDVFRWGVDVSKIFYANHQHKHSREYIEQQIRNSEVIARKKAMELARKKAFDTLAPEFLQVILDRERKQLGLTEELPVASTKIDFINLAPQNEEVEPGVFKLNDGNFAWINNGELITSGIQGKPYATQIGAARARTRNLNRNGHGKS